QSVFDAFMIVASARHYFTGVGAVEQFSYPVWGFLAKKYGLIPIERKKIHSAIGSLAEVENALKNGVSAMIAPEGTRTLTGELGAFKKGAFHVAKNTGITIIPLGLVGAFEAKNKNDWRVRPGVLSTIFGDPITKKDYEDLSIEDLRDLVRSKILELTNS
ncbi:MAG: lysophospholipid acyltransferase family protein, partial [Candidatus Neomarinimicrobiota bacterium]|nr:lysophospholipid acyltransferase family protein [Candidatus Neomarinimicrobiota bacterium]